MKTGKNVPLMKTDKNVPLMKTGKNVPLKKTGKNVPLKKGYYLSRTFYLLPDKIKTLRNLNES